MGKTQTFLYGYIQVYFATNYRKVQIVKNFENFLDFSHSHLGIIVSL